MTPDEAMQELRTGLYLRNNATDFITQTLAAHRFERVRRWLKEAPASAERNEITMLAPVGYKS